MNSNQTTDSKKDLGHIYELLESRDEGNIGIALGMLENDKEYMSAAKKRYLKFIRARLDDPKAGMDGFAKAALSTQEEEMILRAFSLHLDYIYIECLNAKECKTLIDIIGGIAAAYFNAPAYKRHAVTLSNQDALSRYAEKKGNQLRKKIRTGLEIYKEGWFGRILERMTIVGTDFVYTDHAMFDYAETSTVFDEFMFYLDAYQTNGLRFNFFQSYAPAFPDMFWMLSEPPYTVWIETHEEFPYSPMSFKQSCRYRPNEQRRSKIYHAVRNES